MLLSLLLLANFNFLSYLLLPTNQHHEPGIDLSEYGFKNPDSTARLQEPPPQASDLALDLEDNFPQPHFTQMRDLDWSEYVSAYQARLLQHKLDTRARPTTKASLARDSVGNKPPVAKDWILEDVKDDLIAFRAYKHSRRMQEFMEKFKELGVLRGLWEFLWEFALRPETETYWKWNGL